jgi:hypothetical protein
MIIFGLLLSIMIILGIIILFTIFKVSKEIIIIEKERKELYEGNKNKL